MENRIHQLRLKVSAPAGREPSARALADHFTRDVLDRCCNVLEARAPGRVILVREMRLRWSYTETELADPALADRCAAELAESIEAQAEGSAWAGSADAAVLFADEPAWLVSYLKSQANSHADAWFHSAWRGEGLATRLKSDGGADIIRAALLRLERSGDLLAVLTRLPTNIIITLATALNVNGIASYASIANSVSEHDAGPRRRSTTPPSARDQIFPEISRSFPPAFSREDAAIAMHVKVMAQTNDPAIAAGLSQLGPPTIPAARTRPSDAPAPTIYVSGDGQVSLRTRFGGLFYLLSLAVELGIGETLWKACLPEGLILAHAAAAILGPDCAGDPAPLFFGGVTSAEMREFPSVTPEQQVEVSTELLANLVGAIPRRGLAEYPPVYIDIMETPAGRILAACPPGPFAIYAHAAPDARSAADGIAMFLSRWPRSAPLPKARPVLSGLDPSARLLPAPAQSVHAERLIPSVSSSPATALLAQLCGSLGCLFVVRATAAADQSPSTAEMFVSQFLSNSATIRAEPERLTIALPIECIELPLRKSALDRDPGWVEWLKQTVRIEFETGSGEEARGRP